MTLEEIKSEIEKRFNDEISSKRGMPNDFVDGICFGYAECLKMLNQLEPSWHEYPDEKPTEMGYYLTTTPNGKVHEDWYNETRFEERDEEPIAWMELPKPYRKGGSKWMRKAQS